MNRGTFGNITVGGAGTLNSADLSVANYLGGIRVANQLTAAAGTITVTDGASLLLGEISVKNTSTMGAVSLTSGSVAQTTNSTTGATVKGNSITTTTSTASTDSFTLSGLTLAGAEVITLNALRGRALSSISATTIDTTNAIITVAGALNGTVSVGAVTLNAGVNGAVKVNADIGGLTATTNLTTVGAVTLSGATVAFATDKGIFAKAGLTSLTATAASTAANAINFAAATANANLEIGGASGAITLNGNVTMGSNTSAPTILASNGLSSLDSIASITINGSVVGGGVATGKSDIRASSIGDITIKGALSQGGNLVKGLSIIATNNGDAAASTAETISRDGSNLSGYSLGNITVQSTNSIGVAKTQIFATANSFYAAGKIGNITLSGGGSAAVQTSLFGLTGVNTSSTTGHGVAFSVGDGDGVPNSAAGLDFDGNGTIGNGGATVTTFNSSITGAIETAGTFTTVATATIGNISINSAGTGDSVTDIGGIVGASPFGLRILAGVKTTATTDFTTNAILRNDATLNGTVGTITVTNLNQQESVNAQVTAATATNDAATPAGLIAAAGSATSTAANFGAINGVAMVAGTDFTAAGNNRTVGGGDTSLTANEIIVIRI